MIVGKIISISNNRVEVILSDNSVSIGNILCLDDEHLLKVVEVNNTSAICVPFDTLVNVKKSSEVKKYSDALEVEYSSSVFGRILDYRLNPLDNETLKSKKKRNIDNTSVLLQNISLEESPLWTGIKAIDFFTPLNYGDKVCIVGNTGTGKTSLLEHLLINIYKVSSAKSIYGSIASSRYETMELYEQASLSNHLDNMTIISTNLNDTPLKKITSLSSLATIAEYERDEEKKDTLVFIDGFDKYIDALKELNETNIKTDIRHLFERLDSSKDGSITSFITMLNNDECSIKKEIDAVIVLDETQSNIGVYPALDYYKSTSKKVDRNKIGDRHYNLITKVLDTIKRSNELENVINILGIDELSNEDKILYKRSSELKKYFTQKEKEDYVEIDSILDDVEKILDNDFTEEDTGNYLIVGAYGNI